MIKDKIYENKKIVHRNRQRYNNFHLAVFVFSNMILLKNYDEELKLADSDQIKLSHKQGLMSKRRFYVGIL